MSPTYVTVLLPLALAVDYTYRLPDALEGRVTVGSRVVVQFGARRYYTAIVTAVGVKEPEDPERVKEVSDVMGERPIVTPAQLRLWQWIAGYYMCTRGEVMKAALPSGLKIESETQFVRIVGKDEIPAELTPTEHGLLDALKTDKGQSLLDLQKKLGGGNLLRPVRHLMQLGLVSVRETLAETYRPRTVTYVRLTEAYADEVRLEEAFAALHRSPSRERLLLRYLDLADWDGKHAAETDADKSDKPAAPGSTGQIAADGPQLKGSLTPMVDQLLPVAKRDLCNTPALDKALAGLRSMGILETYPVAVSRGGCRPAVTAPGGMTAAQRPLSPEQTVALKGIKAAWQAHSVCLLHGVTSSGKTQIYIRLIEEALARGEQVLYLLPEIALTTQITERLARVFGDRMGVYHSRFPDAERVELWQKQLSPQAFPLILGVRSSLFLPFHRLGLVIVDEEHETSYKQQEPSPRYQARDLAIVLASMAGARVLLGTATPSLETYRHALEGKYGLVRLTSRFGGVSMPRIVVEDVKSLRKKNLMKGKTPFTPRLVEEVRAALARGEQAILFQNRRGWSPVLECRTCGWTPRCSRCDVSLTYHRKAGRLVCHYCGATYDVPTQCPACGGTELRDMGYGTEKIEEAAAETFPDARIARMDLDTTRSRTSYEEIIDGFSRGETNLLIGTQMVTKGLDFDHVSVVGILSADQMLSLPDYRASERAYQMLSQVAGRAGRRGDQGLVILQTRQADNPVIRDVVEADYTDLYSREIADREEFHYPPFYRLISITLKHRDDDLVAHAAMALADLLRPHFGEDLLGPDRPVVSRVQFLYIRKILIKLRPGLPTQGVRRTLLAARDVMLGQAAYKRVHVYFDVDP